MLTLFTGGVRSGKSLMAEQWIMKMSASRLYIATCHKTDAETARRIAAHQERRDATWSCIEEPTDPAAAFRRSIAAGFDGAILLDSLGMWVANMLAKKIESKEILKAGNRILLEFAESGLSCAIVSEECGLGFVPLNKNARAYGDLLGELNQIGATICDNVIFACCGLPLVLKGNL